MADWTDLLGQAINAGTQIYSGQVQKKLARQASRGGGDFPQLGMGLASTGPARGPLSGPSGIPGAQTFGGMQYPAATPAGYLNIGPGGISMGDSMGPMVPRGPQYAIVNTPSGAQRLMAVRSIGTPLLWSGDLAAVRRVARVARKLGRFIHRRPR